MMPTAVMHAINDPCCDWPGVSSSSPTLIDRMALGKAKRKNLALEIGVLEAKVSLCNTGVPLSGE